jgi:hypothetical protein
VENIRLPYLGPGWFDVARRAGAIKVGAHWELPANAVIPPALMAQIEAHQGRKKIEEDRHTPSAIHGAMLAARPTEPAAFDPELVEILAGITEPEQRSAVIADYYSAKIARLLAKPGSLNNTLGGREWIGKIQARESAGDATLGAYAIQLAREATR